MCIRDRSYTVSCSTWKLCETCFLCLIFLTLGALCFINIIFACTTIYLVTSTVISFSETLLTRYFKDYLVQLYTFKLGAHFAYVISTVTSLLFPLSLQFHNLYYNCEIIFAGQLQASCRGSLGFFLLLMIENVPVTHTKTLKNKKMKMIDQVVVVVRILNLPLVFVLAWLLLDLGLFTYMVNY